MVCQIFKLSVSPICLTVSTAENEQTEKDVQPSQKNTLE